MNKEKEEQSKFYSSLSLLDYFTLSFELPQTNTLLSLLFRLNTENHSLSLSITDGFSKF